MPFPDVTFPPETDLRSLLDKLQRFFISARKYWVAASKNELPYYAQTTEPTLITNTVALWKNTTGGGTYYILANFNGTQKKATMT